MRKIIPITATLLLLGTANLYAQCAMCKAVAESSSEEISGIGEGLNLGILYLMAFPYIMIATISYVWYRHNKKQKLQSKTPE
jgi:hypothetical protein